jgi:5'-3' exonuclease
MFPAYQSGRELDGDLIEQSNVIPEFVAACGIANAKASGYEADDFFAASVASALTQTEGAAEVSPPFVKPTMKPRRFRWWACPTDSGP